MHVAIKDGKNDYERGLHTYKDIEHAISYVILNNFRGEIYLSTSLACVMIRIETAYDRLMLPERLIKESFMDNNFDNTKL